MNLAADKYNGTTNSAATITIKLNTGTSTNNTTNFEVKRYILTYTDIIFMVYSTLVSPIVL
jgi:hypothetical protein